MMTTGVTYYYTLLIIIIYYYIIIIIILYYILYILIITKMKSLAVDPDVKGWDTSPDGKFELKEPNVKSECH